MDRMNTQEKNELLLEMIQYSLETHQSVIAKNKKALEAIYSLFQNPCLH